MQQRAFNSSAEKYLRGFDLEILAYCTKVYCKKVKKCTLLTRNSVICTFSWKGEIQRIFFVQEMLQKVYERFEIYRFCKCFRIKKKKKKKIVLMTHPPHPCFPFNLSGRKLSYSYSQHCFIFYPFSVLKSERSCSGQDLGRWHPLLL